jgi:DNA polymerase-3 subunit chi
MTQVDFHFNAPEKMPYVCRLLRKATGQGRKVGVLADQDTCHLLSQALWNLNATDFVTHCALSDPAPILAHSSVIYGSDWTLLIQQSQLDVYLNMNDVAPDTLNGVIRLIEVVGPDERDKASARQRWKQYTQLGFQINRFDLAAAAQSQAS